MSRKLTERRRPTAIIRHGKKSGPDLDYQALEPRQMMSATSDAIYPANFVGPLAGGFHQGFHQESGSTIGRIINGTVTNQYPSVGLIGDNSGYFCSGTLIGSRYVLTAAHCAEGVGQTAGRFQVGSQIYSTSQVFVHPGYNSNLIGSDNANDIAIYKLNRDVTGIAPSPIFRGTPAVGQLLTLVGFGGGGNGNTGSDGSFGTKRVGTTPIDQVTSRLIHWNFDNNFESNTAPGDSGGPAFLNFGGTYFVAGVTSGGDQANAAIGDHSFDTRVDAYAGWIDSIVGTPATSLPSISILAVDGTAAETASGQPVNTASFMVSRTGSLSAPLPVNLASGGTATSGIDYVALPTVVTIPAGAASATFVMTVKDDLLSEGTESVVVSLVGGAGYQINSSSGSTTLSILDNDQPVWNNNFASRQTVSGALTTVSGTNVGATRESGEPNVLGVSGGKSVWWTWTAPATGTVTFSTSGSNFDTTMGVYTGTAVNSLIQIRANDDQNYYAGILTSRVSLYAPAGQTYQILVDGYGGDAGSIKLTVDQPAGRNAKNQPATWLGSVWGNSGRAESVGRPNRFVADNSGRHTNHPIGQAGSYRPGAGATRNQPVGSAVRTNRQAETNRQAGHNTQFATSVNRDEAFAGCLASGFFDGLRAGIR